MNIRNYFKLNKFKKEIGCLQNSLLENADCIETRFIRLFYVHIISSSAEDLLELFEKDIGLLPMISALKWIAAYHKIKYMCDEALPFREEIDRNFAEIFNLAADEEYDLFVKKFADDASVFESAFAEFFCRKFLTPKPGDDIQIYVREIFEEFHKFFSDSFTKFREMKYDRYSKTRSQIHA